MRSVLPSKFPRLPSSTSLHRSRMIAPRSVSAFPCFYGNRVVPILTWRGDMETKSFAIIEPASRAFATQPLKRAEFANLVDKDEQLNANDAAPATHASPSVPETVEDVVAWAKDVLTEKKVPAGGISLVVETLSRNYVIGENLLKLTAKDLIADGAPRGPAMFLAEAIGKLKPAAVSVSVPDVDVTPDVIFNWITTKYGNLAAGPRKKLCDDGMEFRLQEREPALHMICEQISGNVHSWLDRSLNRNNHPIFVIAGTPGIGKTRFMEEAPRLIRELSVKELLPEPTEPNMHTNLALFQGLPQVDINVSFGNGTSSFPQGTAEPLVALVSRLIYVAFIPANVGWGTFAADWAKRFGHTVSLDHALAAIRLSYVRKNPAASDKDLVVNLGVDEFQKLLESDSADAAERRRYLTDLTRVIGSAMCIPPDRVVLNVTFAGTLMEPFRNVFSGSGHPTVHIALANFQRPLELLDTYRQLAQEENRWPESLLNSSTLALLVNDMGGWPRPLTVTLLPRVHALLLQEPTHTRATFQLDAKNLRSLEANVLADLQHRYGAWFQYTQFPLGQVILHALFETRVSLADQVGSFRWDALSSLGLAILLEVPRMSGIYIPHVPPLLVREVARKNSSPTPEDAWTKPWTALFDMVPYDACHDFAAFESFCMNWMLVQPLRLELGHSQTMPVSELFKGGLCTASTNDLSISLTRLKSIRHCKKRHGRWPLAPVTPHRDVAPTAFLNGAGAEACDGAFLQLAADANGKHLDVLFQMKLTESGLTLDLAMIEAEHQKAVDFRRDPKAARKAAREAKKAKRSGTPIPERPKAIPEGPQARHADRFLFVVLANRELQADVVPEALPRDTIVIGKGQLRAFFGNVLVERARLLSHLPRVTQDCEEGEEGEEGEEDEEDVANSATEEM